MMNVATGTSLTVYWLKQANGQEIGQIDRQRLARYLIEAGLDDPRWLALVPFEIMVLTGTVESFSGSFKLRVLAGTI